MYLPAQDGDLVPEHEEFDLLGAAVAGELHQHLQDLPENLVHQRGVHGPDRHARGDPPACTAPAAPAA
jgi:hypothetical protein